MVYRVIYYEGEEKGSTPHAGPLQDTVEFAKAGLIRHSADMARIIDVDGSGAEVESVRRDNEVSNTK